MTTRDARPMLTPLPSPRVGPVSLTLTIGRTQYALDPLACDAPIASRAFGLRKDDGTRYDVAQTPFGAECDCPDFVFRRDGLDPRGCKHVRALVDRGLIEPNSDRRPLKRPVVAIPPVAGRVGPSRSRPSSSVAPSP